MAVSDEDEYYQYFYKNWEEMYRTVSSVTDQPIESVFEVGCGSGVNLMMFRNRGVGRLGGIDYSESLVNTCRWVVDGEMLCGEAALLDTEPKYDIVMADSVFQYFSTVNYAQTVLDKMLEKAVKAVVLCEVHDLEKKEACLSYRRKIVENYDTRYEGLDKLFLSKQWVEDIARKHGKKVLFTEDVNDVYLNSDIYNAYLY